MSKRSLRHIHFLWFIIRLASIYYLRSRDMITMTFYDKIIDTVMCKPIVNIENFIMVNVKNSNIESKAHKN